MFSGDPEELDGMVVAADWGIEFYWVCESDGQGWFGESGGCGPCRLFSLKNYDIFFNLLFIIFGRGDLGSVWKEAKREAMFVWTMEERRPWEEKQRHVSKSREE